MKLFLIIFMAASLTSCSNNKQKAQWETLKSKESIVCSSPPNMSNRRLNAYENDKVIFISFEKKGMLLNVKETLKLIGEGFRFYQLAKRETRYVITTKNNKLTFTPWRTKAYQESFIGKSKWPIPRTSIKQLRKFMDCS